ncbi:GNAT family N-acetyltransferase [Atopococcus tabaci]|uniref:GNAT family N-acetyltransferase n=1 Tax=Atopococcus tabaci TaxID=269774 RepID=UPI0004294A06|nr:GNAT family N-acetyltransferase [Atopococcus tabaci]
MNTITYKFITKETAQELRLPNEPFNIFGRMVVNRIEDEWSYTTELFDETTTMTFPEEAYDVDQINRDGFAIGAYDGEICVGLAVYQNEWAKYMYLHDLKVNKAYRKHGIAGELITRGLEEAKKRGYAGVFTIGQDNNLAACKFYLKQGFVIGGLNTHGYNHTPQEGKADIYFYLE